MEPWLVSLIVMCVVQIAGFAFLIGVMHSKLAATAGTSDRNHAAIQEVALAAASERASAEGVALHVGDMEIRIRTLERASG